MALDEKDPRQKTAHLAKKLFLIREAMGLSQTQLLRVLDLTDYYHHTRISLWERGYREPPINVLLRYARVAGISTDVLIDDDLELPGDLFSKRKPRKKPGAGVRSRSKK